MNANGTMETARRLNPLVAGAVIAVMLFSGVGIAAITGLLPGAFSHKNAETAPVVGADPKACSICGTVESIRSVEVRGEASGLCADLQQGHVLLRLQAEPF